jgi:hypothetical protein
MRWEAVGAVFPAEHAGPVGPETDPRAGGEPGTSVPLGTRGRLVVRSTPGVPASSAGAVFPRPAPFPPQPAPFPKAAPGPSPCAI